jgi:hypothetical protein
MNRYIGHDVFGGKAALTEQSLASELDWLVRAFSCFSSALLGLLIGLLIASNVSGAEQVVVSIASTLFGLWLGARYYKICCVFAGIGLISLICADFAIGLFS